MKKTFDVYFSGELLEGYEPDRVKEAVGKMFGLSGPRLEALFSGVPVRVKKNLGVDKAGRLRKAFLELGALVQIVPAGEEPGTLPLSITGSGLRLAPREPLKAEPADRTAPLPDPGRLSLVPLEESGKRETTSEEEPPPLPDTSHLQVLPPESGTLEEYAPSIKPTPIPDISRLSLEE